MSTDDTERPDDLVQPPVEVIELVETGDPTSMDERFASLEQSNVALATDVRALTATLQVVNELQIEQRAQARRQQVLGEEVEATRIETDVRIRRTRRALSMATVAMAVLLPLVSILVYAVLLNHVNDLLDRNARDRRTACEQRNEGTKADVRRERLLASIEDDAQARRIHTESANEIEATLINCAQVYRTTDNK